jgi:hypothetical protein
MRFEVDISGTTSDKTNNHSHSSLTDRMMTIFSDQISLTLKKCRYPSRTICVQLNSNLLPLTKECIDMLVTMSMTNILITIGIIMYVTEYPAMAIRFPNHL